MNNSSADLNWHCDNERLHGSLGNPFSILSLSLGSERTFWIQRKRGPTLIEVPMRQGDLLVMTGLFQKEFLHKYYFHVFILLLLHLFRVPEAKNVFNPRINITFRWILDHHVRSYGCGENHSGTRIPDLPLQGHPLFFWCLDFVIAMFVSKQMTQNTTQTSQINPFSLVFHVKSRVTHSLNRVNVSCRPQMWVLVNVRKFHTARCLQTPFKTTIFFGRYEVYFVLIVLFCK